MPRPEVVDRHRSAAPAVRARLCGWGGGRRVDVELVRPRAIEQVAATLAETDAPAIARGMGRSYGDAAQREGGLVIDLHGCGSFVLDASAGTVRTSAGVTLATLLGALAPAGWTLPVVPGTQHVTVGGAIACDVHGKNHPEAGSFGTHVRALGLLTSGGELLELSPERRGDLFAATIGGLGLTGIVAWAQLALTPLPPDAVLSVDTDRVAGLEEALEALDAPDGGPHRVAWLDLLAEPLARGIVTRGALVGGGLGRRTRGEHGLTVAARGRVPAGWPGGALRPSTLRAHNSARFALAPARRRDHREPFGRHMFQLDALDAWPRLYGAGGLVQYQCAVPVGEERALERLLARRRSSGVLCCLAVLKRFGAHEGGPLSFPLPGWTLALDFPGAAPGLPALLDTFDEIVLDAGGRVYFAKDARLEARTVAAMYPRLGEFAAARDSVDPDRRWQSDLAVRAGLTA